MRHKLKTKAKLETQNPGNGKEPANKLHSETSLGYVDLQVSDLERSKDYYQRAIGLKVGREIDNQVSLAVGERTLLVLTEMPGADKIPRRSGLYHFALLVPSREALGKTLRNLVDTGTEIQGGADHLVSEAIYLADPDGNGIELYRDRPRDEWQYENGQIKMATDPLDYQGIIASTNGSDGNWDGIAEGTRLGHMHLHVGDLNQAVNFYEKVLGFDFLMNYMNSAAFLSAGGYHHHIGLNTWNGIGAPPNPPDAVGLKYFSVELVGDDELRKLIDRLDQIEWSYEEINSGILVRDPSENGILIKSGFPPG
jgi:catechol 2,3-dioxygenase